MDTNYAAGGGRCASGSYLLSDARRFVRKRPRSWAWRCSPPAPRRRARWRRRRGAAAPQVVIVDTFAAAPDEVKLDEGLSTEVEQAVKARTAPRAPPGDTGRPSGRRRDRGQAVVEIQDMGLRAERGSAVPSGTQNALLIKGQLVSIDEGNRTERVLVGLGAGRSDVRTHAQVYEVTPTGTPADRYDRGRRQERFDAGDGRDHGGWRSDRPPAGVDGGRRRACMWSTSPGRRRGRRRLPRGQGHRQAAFERVCEGGLDVPEPRHALPRRSWQSERSLPVRRADFDPAKRCPLHWRTATFEP